MGPQRSVWDPKMPAWAGVGPQRPAEDPQKPRWASEASIGSSESSARPSEANAGPYRPAWALRGQCGAVTDRHGRDLEPRDQRKALIGQGGPSEADADP